MFKTTHLFHYEGTADLVFRIRCHWSSQLIFWFRMCLHLLKKEEILAKKVLSVNIKGCTEAFYWLLEGPQECHINVGFKRQLLPRWSLAKEFFVFFFPSQEFLVLVFPTLWGTWKQISFLWQTVQKTMISSSDCSSVRSCPIGMIIILVNY